MIKSKLLLIGLLTLLAATVTSQEVILTDFPAGVARDIDKGFFDTYRSELQTVADTLTKYPKALAIVTGGADGLRFHRYNDALNPGIALGRAHALREYLITELKIDSNQILVQSADYKVSGGKNRYASVRVSMKWLNDETPTVVMTEPVVQQMPEPLPPETTIVKTDMVEHLGMQLGGGLSSSPFGLIPIVSGGLTWKQQIFIEGIFGQTFWDDNYNFSGTNLETKSRISGVTLAFLPFEHTPVGIIGGWFRFEEISDDYYKYVRLSEGPIIGLKATPLENLSITGVYHATNRRDSDKVFSFSDNDQFLLYAVLHVNFGGAK